MQSPWLADKRPQNGPALSRAFGQSAVAGDQVRWTISIKTRKDAVATVAAKASS
jgi:hypothetical protein